MQDKMVKIREVSEQKILYQFDIEELPLAYKKASELELMGIDVEIIAPSAPETLALALGSNKEEIEKLKISIEHEISEHELEACIGCIATKP